jgi:two-component system, sensor histidine kinase LadS
MAEPKEQISARLSRAKADLEVALVEIEKLPILEAGAVAFAAHALKNFLTVTNATTELLRLRLAGTDDAEVTTLLAGLDHTTDLMTYTVGRLMNTTRKTDTVLVSQDLDIARLVYWARNYYQRGADRKKIEIIAECPAPTMEVCIDSVAFGAALDNLLSNAIKYSPAGKKIWLRLVQEPAAVVVSVQDQGPGLSVEDQARLFQKGVRLTPQPTGGESSTGYGLAVAKELVSRMGGTIWCDSNLGAGACFSIRVPTAPLQGSAGTGSMA